MLDLALFAALAVFVPGQRRYWLYPILAVAIALPIEWVFLDLAWFRRERTVFEFIVSTAVLSPVIEELARLITISFLPGTIKPQTISLRSMLTFGVAFAGAEVVLKTGRLAAANDLNVLTFLSILPAAAMHIAVSVIAITLFRNTRTRIALIAALALHGSYNLVVTLAAAALQDRVLVTLVAIIAAAAICAVANRVHMRWSSAHDDALA